MMNILALSYKHHAPLGDIRQHAAVHSQNHYPKWLWYKLSANWDDFLLTAKSAMVCFCSNYWPSC